MTDPREHANMVLDHLRVSHEQVTSDPYYSGSDDSLLVGFAGVIAALLAVADAVEAGNLRMDRDR